LSVNFGTFISKQPKFNTTVSPYSDPKKTHTTHT